MAKAEAVWRGVASELAGGGTAGQPGDVRPGAAGLITGVECSRVRDSAWMYLISFVTTRIGVELAAVQENYLIVL